MAKDYVAKSTTWAAAASRSTMLNAGAVVKPFSVMDGVQSGVLDGAHSVPAYWYGKHRAASLFGTGPSYGFNANQCLGWIYYGGGQALYDELHATILASTWSASSRSPCPRSRSAGSRRKSPADDVQGLEVSHRRSRHQHVPGDGCERRAAAGRGNLPAMERGVIEAFEFNNPTSDSRFGAQDVAKFYILGSYHQAAETFEITFNKTKYDSLPKEQQQILRYAVQAAAADNEWKAWDQYSKDLDELITKKGVNVKRTPKSIFDAQLKAWDQVEKDLVADPKNGPFIKKVLDSQKAWAKRVGFYFFNNDADYKSAYEHHFGALKT